jgi:hypothetical protein
VPKASQRFERLAAHFEMIAQDLSACQNPKERRELLKEMMLVLEQMADLCMNEHSLDSKPDGTSPSNPPLSKAAHQ